MDGKVNIPGLREMKASGNKIAMLTAYDYPTALLLDQAGIDMILVGDSLGMVVLGYEDTVPVTMEEMVHHTRAVVRASKRALVVADMPFMSYNISKKEALRNAGRLIKEGGAAAVKLEGGRAFAETVKAMVDGGIPVMGHLGLTPQTAAMLGGYKVQGRGSDAAERILNDAVALEEAGIFSLVLECVPSSLGKEITSRLSVPTIGIGAGPDCDGQVLVFHDLVGLFDRFVPRFVKQYTNIKQSMVEAVERYSDEVKQGSFPDKEHSFQ